MTRIVNPNTIRPDELKPGDVMVAVVALHVQHHGPPYFTMYHCPMDGRRSHDGVPQGNKIFDNCEALAKALFPVVLHAGMESAE